MLSTCLPELDTPGEWYSGPNVRHSLFLAARAARTGKGRGVVIPTLVSMNKVSYVTVRGLTFEPAADTAIVAREATHVQIVGCTIRNTGSWGVELSGSQSGVVGCDICDTGNGGVSLSGGDRTTLSPGRPGGRQQPHPSLGPLESHVPVGDLSQWRGHPRYA